MKSIYLLPILLAFAASQAIAQISEHSPTINETHAGMVYNNTTIRIKPKNNILSYEEARRKYSEIGGSPYLHKNLIPLVNLHMSNGQVIQNARIQYDCFQNEILVTKGDYQELIIETAFFDLIESPTNDMPYPLRRANRDKPTKFYEILYQDSLMTLYKDTQVQIMRHSRNIPGQVQSTEKFYRAVSYYIARGRRTPVEINLKKDDIFRMIPKIKRGELKLAMQELGLKKLKKEEDYVLALNYFSTATSEENTE
jgi:hypothetical protein